MATPFDHPYPNSLKRFPALRQSLLSTFDNCGLSASFDLAYREGWNTAPQGRGSIFHRVAAECLREMWRHKEESIPVDAALTILGEVLAQPDADRVCPRCGTTRIKPGVDKRGERTCENRHHFSTELINVPLEQVKDLHWTVAKWASEAHFDIHLLVDVEQRLSAEIGYPNRLTGGVVHRTLTGQLDALLVDETATRGIVVDWKDTWAVPAEGTEDGKDEVSVGGYFQQRFYAYLLFHNYPSIQFVTLREVYPRRGEVRELTVSRAQEEAIERELAALVERFDRAFDTQPASVVPTPGRHCSFCLAPRKCPILPEAREEGQVVDEQTAEKLAWEVIVSSEILKKSKAALSAYADLHGPIPVKSAKGMRALGFVPQTRTKRPDIEAIELAEREKGSPLTSSEIRGLYRTTTGTRFGFFTPKEVDEGAAEAEIEAKLMESIALAQAQAEMRAAQRDDEPPDRHLKVVA